MERKKAQATLEFLMTYGWALLISLVATAALMYWGVLDLNYLPDFCMFGVGFACISPLFQDTGPGIGVIELTVANQIGKDLSDFYIVMDPDNTYCGGWFSFISNGFFPGNWNRSAPFRYGQIDIAGNLLPDGSRFRELIFCDCPAGSLFNCGSVGEPNLRICCDSDSFSETYFNPPFGLCPGYTSNMNTCRQGVNMHSLKRFKSNLKIYYRELGSNILHLRTGQINLPYSGRYTSLG